MEELIAWGCSFVFLCRLISPNTVQIGKTEDGVPAYRMSDRSIKKINKVEWNGHHIVTGKKWESLEFARRYLLLTKGVMFDDIEKAVELWAMPTFYDAAQNTPVPFKKYRIGAVPPQAGDILVWAMSDDAPDGHVAIVVHSDGEHMVQIAEQNWNKWKDPHYSRNIHLLSHPRLLGFIRV